MLDDLDSSRTAARSCLLIGYEVSKMGPALENVSYSAVSPVECNNGGRERNNPSGISQVFVRGENYVERHH